MLTPNTKEIYTKLEYVWPQNSKWYDYTHNTICAYVHKRISSLQTGNITILNAGSGGSNYGLDVEMYHLDISPNLISKCNHQIVASVEDIPCASNSFDVIICVGSVINYCSALEAITEMARVLRPSGLLILEYERSNSAELWGSKEYGKTATYQSYNYLDETHNLWLYSDKYIKKIVVSSGLQVDEYKRFHSLSAVVNRITKDEDFAGKFATLDCFFRPFSYLMADNCILSLYKTSHF